MSVISTANMAGAALSSQRATAPLSGGSNGARGPDDARLKTALTALESLKRPASDAAQERKAAAARKVEALKARIQMLRMSGGDPAATARAVAALARELGAAVKAYAAAGGGSGTGETQAAAASAAGSASQAADPADAGTDAGTEVSTESQAPAEAGPETAGKTADEKTGEAETDASPANPYQKTIDRLQADAADRARRNADREADERFSADVKGLAATLKAILREAELKARRENRPLDDAETEAADKVLSQAIDAAQEISTPIDAAGAIVGAGVSIVI